jgi:hypothetical protein
LHLLHPPGPALVRTLLTSNLLRAKMSGDSVFTCEHD